MIATARELIEAKEAVAALLDRLGLEAYLFDLEPHDGRSGVRVECARAGVWQSVTLTVDMQALLESRTDASIRSRLLDDWSKRLCAPDYGEPLSANC